MGCNSSKIHEYVDKNERIENELYIIRRDLEDKNKIIEQLEHELHSTNVSTRNTIIKMKKQISNSRIDSPISK